MSLDRILIAIVGIAFLVWYFRNYWQKTSAYSEAEAEKQRLWEEGFSKFKNDPRFLALKKHVDAQYKTTFDKPLDDESYQIIYTTFADEKMQELPLDNPTPKYLMIFLTGKKGKLQFTMDLHTQQIHETKGMGGHMYVPYWAK